MRGEEGEIVRFPYIASGGDRGQRRERRGGRRGGGETGNGMADFASSLLLRRTPRPPLPGGSGRRSAVVSDNARYGALPAESRVLSPGARALRIAPPVRTGNPIPPWRWSPTPLPRERIFSGAPLWSPRGLSICGYPIALRGFAYYEPGRGGVDGVWAYYSAPPRAAGRGTLRTAWMSRPGLHHRSVVSGAPAASPGNLTAGRPGGPPGDGVQPVKALGRAFPRACRDSSTPVVSDGSRRPGRP